MALVKQEDENGVMESGDAWMAYWANPETDAATVKLEEEKPSLPDLESDSEESCTESVITDDAHVAKKEIGEPVNKTKAERKERKMNHNRDATREKKGKKAKDDWCSQSLEERLMNAPVSTAVANMCAYQCPNCKSKMIARDSLTMHFKRLHSDFKKGKYNDYLIKIVAHQCSICSKLLLCDKRVILSHLLKVHTISSLKKYCDQENLLNMRGVPNFKIKHDIFDKRDLQRNKISKNLGNYCKFECNMCGFSSNAWRKMAKHIKENDHGRNLGSNCYATSKTFIECSVCNQFVLCDRQIFVQHLCKHKLTLREYNTKMKLPNLEQLLPQYHLELKKVIMNIPAVEPRRSCVSDSSHFRVNQLTRHIGNLTFFKCPLCSETGMSYRYLTIHCKKKHQLLKQQFNLEYVVEARYHKCHICNKALLCDKHYIKRHVIKTHKINLGIYIKDYVLKNNCIVFPTFKQYQQNNQIFEEMNANKGNCYSNIK